jgi:phosphohistidine phosphatase
VKLYLMRHCQPVLGHPMDSARQLTPEGHRQAGEMAAFMVRHIGRVDITISSPFARTMETAEVMADALGSHIVATKLLEPEAEPPDAWKEIERIAQAAEHVLIVGHDPSINKLLGWLISGGNTKFEHGAIAHVKADTKDKGSHPRVQGTLHWFVDVKIVERDVLKDQVVEAARTFAEALAG